MECKGSPRFHLCQGEKRSGKTAAPAVAEHQPFFPPTGRESAFSLERHGGGSEGEDTELSLGQQGAGTGNGVNARLEKSRKGQDPQRDVWTSLSLLPTAKQPNRFKFPPEMELGVELMSVFFHFIP